MRSVGPARSTSGMAVSLPPSAGALPPPLTPLSKDDASVAYLIEECVRAHLRFYVMRAGHHVESKRRSMQLPLAEHDSRRASLCFGHAGGNQIEDQKSAYAMHAMSGV